MGDLQSNVPERVLLIPQPKYGKPFQLAGERTGVFLNENPRYPKSSDKMFSYSWRVPAGWNPFTTTVEKNADGMYEWVREAGG